MKNTEQYAGEEVVQMYIRDKVASAAQPVKELKGFQKVCLEPAEHKEITFILTNETLSFYRADMSWGSEPRDLMIFIGGNSRDRQTTEFQLNN